ncbi:hypothetical protein [Mycobacteroides abscessus]|nr:hypothetical protein [Mycobacteroides abscessus]
MLSRSRLPDAKRRQLGSGTTQALVLEKPTFVDATIPHERSEIG